MTVIIIIIILLSQVTLLERLLEQRDAVTLVLARESITSLTDPQWTTAGDLVITLLPFLDVTVMMSAAEYPTLSMVIPVLDGLKDLLQTTTGGLDVLRDLYIAAINSRFGDVFDDGELCAATIVDPRFKDVLFVTEDQKTKAVESTVSRMLQAAQGSTGETPAPAVVALAPVASSTANTAPTTAPTTPSRPLPSPSTLTPQQRSIWSKFEIVAASSPSAIRQNPVAAKSRESLQRELDHYLQEPLIDRAAGCPFQWWAENKTRFPSLALLAQKLLCIPATSVPSERLFSKAGDVITKKRSSLAPKKAEMVIFLMEN
jgi:zinc finger BED domain-containing protein 1 (E3 SUMO-protein ligase ZBED1)